MESPTSVGRNFFFPISWVFLDIDFFLFLNAHVCEVWLQGPFCLSYPLFPGAPEACGKNWESGPGIQRFPPRHPRPELLGLWVNECIFWNWGDGTWTRWVLVAPCFRPLRLFLKCDWEWSRLGTGEWNLSLTDQIESFEKSEDVV